MKSLGAGALLISILIMANVVAAGVFAILGPVALELDDDAARVAAVVIVGVLAVGAAIAFLRGALLLVLADPYKGLQSAAGRRGG